MRGKQIVSTLKNLYKGITPAYAGKTNCFYIKEFIQRDHPRVCGENVAVALYAIHVYGSPPRMRGKPSNVTAFDGQPRITPAYAGKTVQRHGI